MKLAYEQQQQQQQQQQPYNGVLSYRQPKYGGSLV
jgi:hypothetical protein